MKIGLFIGIGRASRGDVVMELSRQAERLGFASLWAPEHVVLLEKYNSQYPYSNEGSCPMAPDRPLPSPLITLSFAAAVTEKIRLGTGICLLGEHNPVVIAKDIATLDAFSGGRFLLGVGIGWLAEEYQALGVPFERRAQRTREYIAFLRQLWGESKTTFHGEFINVEGIFSSPKPVAGAKLPIYFGGESGPALKRVAEVGDGWIGWNLLPDEAAAKHRQLLGLIEKAGRDPRSIEIIVSPYTKPCSPADLKGYQAAGVQEVVLTLRQPSEAKELKDWLEKVAEKWVKPAADLD